MCYFVIPNAPKLSMSAASRQNDVLQMFKGETSQQVNRRHPPPPLPINQREDVFFTSQNNYFEWLRVWKMIVSERNPHNKDLFAFERAQKESFTQLIKRELEELKNIKVSLEMKVKFKKENEEGEIQCIENYFREDHPEFFSKNDDENKIKGYFEDTFEKNNNKIDQWVKEGSGWKVEKLSLST